MLIGNIWFSLQNIQSVIYSDVEWYAVRTKNPHLAREKCRANITITYTNGTNVVIPFSEAISASDLIFIRDKYFKEIIEKISEVK